MNHSNVIDLWPSLREFADDLGVSYGTAKAMRRRGRIPPEYWLRIVGKAEDRSIMGVSTDALAAGIAREAAE